MSVDVYLGLTALDRRQAVSRASRCHVHLAARPFVVVGYHLPGDPGAPIGLVCGSRRQQPRTVIVGEPREARLRFERLADFAMDLNGYMGQYMQRPARARGTQAKPGRLAQAPQLVVPNEATAQWLCDIMGTRLRYLPTEGEFAVHPALPTAGAHLSFYAGQRVPGSSLVLALTEVLSQHWVTGQLAALDANLASQLAWITTTDRLEDLELKEVEEALPAGPVPDPEWETRELSDAIKAYHRLREVHPTRADQPMRDAVNAALLPTWNRCWDALEALRGLPVAAHVTERWNEDARQWDYHAERVRSGQAFFLKRPKQLQVFRYLTRLERLTANLAREMALDDPLIMAGHLAAGDALSAEVVLVDFSGRRPVLRVRPHLSFPRPPGTELFLPLPPVTKPTGVTWPMIKMVTTEESPDGLLCLDVTAGAVRRDRWNLLPEPGQHIILAPFGPRDFHPDTLPTELPWTHAEDEDEE